VRGDRGVDVARLGYLSPRIDTVGHLGVLGLENKAEDKKRAELFGQLDSWVGVARGDADKTSDAGVGGA
jgi:hypothetical protein